MSSSRVFFTCIKRMIPVLILAALLFVAWPHVPGSPLACLAQHTACSGRIQGRWFGGSVTVVVFLLIFACGRKVKGATGDSR